MALVFLLLVLAGALFSNVHGQNPSGGPNGGSTGFIPIVVNPSPGAASSNGFFSSPSAPSASGPFFAAAPSMPAPGPGPALSGPLPVAPAPAMPPGTWPVRPQSNLDALSGYAAEFLTSINRDQLTAFLRVYFMSKMMGTSLLDPRATLTRAVVDPQDRRAIETVRSMPMVPSQMASLESTQVGAILNTYAARMKSATPAQRGYLVRDYQNTIENLQIPKGVKYALKHIM